MSTRVIAKTMMSLPCMWIQKKLKKTTLPDTATKIRRAKQTSI